MPGEVGGRGKGDERQRCEAPGEDAGIGDTGGDPHGKVPAAAADVGEVVVEGKLHAERRMTLQKRCQGAQQGLGERGGGGYAHRACDPNRCTEAAGGCRQCQGRPSHLGEEALTVGCHGERAGRAAEQARTVRGLKAADQAGDGGRGYAKLARGPGEGAGLGNAENDNGGAQGVHGSFDTSGWHSRNTVGSALCGPAPLPAGTSEAASDDAHRDDVLVAIARRRSNSQERPPVMSNLASEQARQPATSFDLTGKRVVVVGGKKAIGLGVAQAAHAMGAAVTVASRRDVPAGERPDLAAFDQIVLDIRDEAAVQTAFEAIGAFDHLVVTAGPEMGSWGSFMDADMRGVRSYLEGKFLGTWACARHAAPHLLAGGSMTFLTGGTGARAKLGLAAVTSTFAAVASLSQSLALELAPIRVNTIQPGFIDTDFWDVLPAATVAEIRAKVRANLPARRLGTAADVGHAAVFLMTNPYVTGTVLEVSGGELLVDWLF